MTIKYIGGIHAVTLAIDNKTAKKILLIKGKNSKNINKLVALAEQKDIEIELVEYYQLDIILPNLKHQGVVALVDVLSNNSSWQDVITNIDKPFILLLDHLQDPHNLGACLRSAWAFGVNVVLLPKDRAAGITPVVEKVSCGASQSLAIFTVTNLKNEVRVMKEMGLLIVGADGKKGESLHQKRLNLPICLVMGNENTGISFGLQQLCDDLISIPINPDLDSLNVSVATGILLSEIIRQNS